MTKHNRSSSSSQHAYTHSMPVSLAPSHPADLVYNPRQQMTLNPAFYSLQSAPDQASMVPQAYDLYGAAVMPPVPPQQSMTPRASSGAWSPQDDSTLLAARQQGLNWQQINREHFKDKTPNACRKRHERLMERRGANDFDQRKMERIAKEYMSMRKEIWQPLAQRVGEKWTVVEAKCMNNGIKNIQNAARAAGRREKVESGQSFSQGYDDDSGISGIGLTPIDDLDSSYSSPETVSSSSSAGSSSFHGGMHPMHYGHQAYGHNYTTSTGALSSGYSSSVSSTTAQAYGHHSQEGSPYMSHVQRLPSVDMGIDAIINRPGHGGVPHSM